LPPCNFRIAFESIFTVSGSTQAFQTFPETNEATVVRTHGQLAIDATAMTGATGKINMGFGVGIINAELSAGAALGDFPNPATLDGASWDGWFVHQMVPLGDTGTWVEPETVKIDSKAMRKLQGGNLFVIVFGLSGGSVTGQVSAFFSGRFLLKQG